MGGIRKLFINDTGLDRYARSVMANTEDNEDVSYADIIDCKEKIINQLKLAVKLPKVKSISVSEDGDIRIRTNDLFIKTEDTGKLRKFFVGKWEVVVDRYGSFRFKSNNKDELGFRSSVWGSNTVHPHISGRDNHACLGNAQAPLQLYLKTGAIKTLVIFVLGYLESVNVEDTAGRWLGACKEVKLDDEGNPVHDDTGNYMFIRNEFDRLDTRQVASTRRSTVDLKYNEYLTVRSVSCYGCGAEHNEDRLERTQINGETCYICKDCKSKYKACDACGDYTKDLVEYGSVSLCKRCVNNFFPKCNICGCAIVPADINKDNMNEKIIAYRTNKDTIKDCTALFKDDAGNYIFRGICPTCRDLVNTPGVFKDSVVSFKKAEVSQEIFKRIKEIPVHKYTLYIGLNPKVPIEETTFDMYEQRPRQVATDIMDLTGVSGYSSTGYKAKAQSITRQYIENNMVNVYSGIDTLQHKMNVKAIPVNIYAISSGMTVVDKNIFKDLDNLNDEVVNLDGMIPTQATRNCTVCGTVIEDDELSYLDKFGNSVCASCADHLYTSCEKCHKPVKVTTLGKNNNAAPEQANWCDKCRQEMHSTYEEMHSTYEEMIIEENTDDEMFDDEIFDDEDLPF